LVEVSKIKSSTTAAAAVAVALDTLRSLAVLNSIRSRSSVALAALRSFAVLLVSRLVAERETGFWMRETPGGDEKRKESQNDLHDDNCPEKC